MQISPFFLILISVAGTLGIGQALLPTAHAQPVNAAPALPAQYQVLVQSLHTKRTSGGLEITGQLINTGSGTLTYTSIVTVFTDASGAELSRGTGYLAAGPILPGQATEFRGCGPETPRFTGVFLLLHESGHSVIVKCAPLAKPALRAGQMPNDRLVVKLGLKQRPVAPAVTGFQDIRMAVQ
ncbi:MAG: FxLYD domain-containing protein [Janthinobacterium lividum]